MRVATIFVALSIAAVCLLTMPQLGQAAGGGECALETSKTWNKCVAENGKGTLGTGRCRCSGKSNGKCQCEKEACACVCNENSGAFYDGKWCETRVRRESTEGSTSSTPSTTPTSSQKTSQKTTGSDEGVTKSKKGQQSQRLVLKKKTQKVTPTLQQSDDEGVKKSTSDEGVKTSKTVEREVEKTETSVTSTEGSETTKTSEEGTSTEGTSDDDLPFVDGPLSPETLRSHLGKRIRVPLYRGDSRPVYPAVLDKHKAPSGADSVAADGGLCPRYLLPVDLLKKVTSLRKMQLKGLLMSHAFTTVSFFASYADTAPSAKVEAGTNLYEAIIPVVVETVDLLRTTYVTGDSSTYIMRCREGQSPSKDDARIGNGKRGFEWTVAGCLSLKYMKLYDPKTNTFKALPSAPEGWPSVTMRGNKEDGKKYDIQAFLKNPRNYTPALEGESDEGTK